MIGQYFVKYASSECGNQEACIDVEIGETAKETCVNIREVIRVIVHNNNKYDILRNMLSINKIN